jgi:hypothetical protein
MHDTAGWKIPNQALFCRILIGVVDLDLKTPTPIVSGWKINNGEIKPYGAAIEMGFKTFPQRVLCGIRSKTRRYGRYSEA